MVSHPETGSDSPIGSDRDRGRDTFHISHMSVELIIYYHIIYCHRFSHILSWLYTIPFVIFYFQVLLLYTVHVLCSCTNFIYCIHVLFHVLFMYYFHILFSCYIFHITFSFIYISCH